MTTPYLGEIKMISWNFAPSGWAFCDGQLMSISQNQALFSLLGTNFGGNGVSSFALPDLRGRTPFYVGNGLVLGQAGGEAAHTLTVNEIPGHAHVLSASSNGADAGNPVGNFLASSGNLNFARSGPNTALDPSSIAGAGAGQPHDNLSPYLVLNFVIALQGTFPTQT